MNDCESVVGNRELRKLPGLPRRSKSTEGVMVCKVPIQLGTVRSCIDEDSREYFVFLFPNVGKADSQRVHAVA